MREDISNNILLKWALCSNMLFNFMQPTGDKTKKEYDIFKNNPHDPAVVAWR